MSDDIIDAAIKHKVQVTFANISAASVSLYQIRLQWEDFRNSPDAKFVLIYLDEAVKSLKHIEDVMHDIESALKDKRSGEKEVS